MTSPIGSVTAFAGLPATGLGADMSVGTATTNTAATPGAGGTSFANVLASSLDSLQGTQSKADNLAVQAATGDLKDVHDYMIASNEASLSTQMVVTIKNKAVDAFNQIMGMPV
jgi:flagellar hook-basal body complex protein FliE